MHSSFSPSLQNQQQEMRGSEEQRYYLWARNYLKRIQQPITNYNQLLEQPEMGQTLNPHNHSHTNRNSATLEPPKSKGCRPASQ